jgi:hypothetical protein
MRARHRVRLAVNLANGSTLAGVGVALAGRARLARAADGLLTGTGYRLPVPPAPAFTMGNVIITRRDELVAGSSLFRHEARHTTQYAWCGGLLMLPLYFTAAGASWLLCGDFGSWNVFERGAGLADGGYADRPLRVVLQRRPRRAPGESRAPSETGLPATGPGDHGPGLDPGEHGGLPATSSPLAGTHRASRAPRCRS